MKEKLTQEYLKECLTYDPDTGIFVWNERPISHFKNANNQKAINAKFANKEAGSMEENGYIQIRINRKLYLAHRLAFFFIEGYFPENLVDHIDRNPSNNKWDNLREASQVCNMQNRTISKNNTSLVTGVHLCKKNNLFQARIVVARKTINLGTFKNFNDAVMARYHEELTNPLWSCSVETPAYKYLKDNDLLEEFYLFDVKKSKLKSNNTSGVNGVTWNNKINRWISYILIDSKIKSLGCFEKFIDAVMARYNEEINNPLWEFSKNSSSYNYLKDNDLLEAFKSVNFNVNNLNSNNTSGVTGVVWNKLRNKWNAQIAKNNKNIGLGSFDNFEDAVIARYHGELNLKENTNGKESTAYKYLKEHNLI